jgi:hypothetical protein
MAGNTSFYANSGGKVNSKVRIYNNKIVTPTLYTASCSRRKMVGTIDGEVICYKSGTPIPLNQIGYLDYPDNLQKDL